jgi:hypothetical protein
MGAFDAELYRLGYRFPALKEAEAKPSVPKGFYVSWKGNAGGFTGKWSETKEEADNTFNEMLKARRHPLKWYEDTADAALRGEEE